MRILFVGINIIPETAFFARIRHHRVGFVDLPALLDDFTIQKTLVSAVGTSGVNNASSFSTSKFKTEPSSKLGIRKKRINLAENCVSIQGTQRTQVTAPHLEACADF
jgi:hypothetical protein